MLQLYSALNAVSRGKQVVVVKKMGIIQKWFTDNDGEEVR